MVRWIGSLLLVLASPAAGTAAQAVAGAAEPALLPVPTAMTARPGTFAIGETTAIVVPAGDRGAMLAAEELRHLLQATVGTVPRIGGAGGSGGAIRFVRDTGFAAEGYRLSVSPTSPIRGATITAGTDAGLFYGAVTLSQLAVRGPGGVGVAGAEIADAPRFRWRGLMLDSARHFQSPAFVKRLIDAMAAVKLNTLHWHLVDDQGWRLPVPGYPRLTAVSAWRRGATASGAPPLPREGGFYTEAQIRDIVAYAARRHVTVVPEIEMPGHALAAIRAYPALGTGTPVPDQAWSDYGVFPWLYNIDEGTFRFLERVLDQVMRLFPSPYVHVGGDEATKEQWKASPAIQARMRRLGIASEDQLQGWFMKRIGGYLAAHDRRMIGWDEILDGGITPGATVMSWRGIDGAVKAARAGHDAILSPSPVLYLDHLQGGDAAEGPGREGVIALREVYGFDPAPATLSPAEQAHILGVQGNLWTEYVLGDARAGQMLFPRGLAVAEIGWSARTTGFDDFAVRVAAQDARLRSLGIAGSEALFRPVATLAPQGEGGMVTLATQTGLPVRYTLDGTAPDVRAPLYRAPVAMPFGTRFRAASMIGERPLPGGIDLGVDAASVRHRDDTQLALCTEKVPLRLPDDYPADPAKRAAFRIDIFNPCWTYAAAPMDGVRAIAIDVGQVPFNFQVGHDADGIRLAPPETPGGEFVVRDGCAGARLATLPLAPAIANPGVTRLTAALPPLEGAHDLCITYTARGLDPLRTVAGVQLIVAP